MKHTRTRARRCTGKIANPTRAAAEAQRSRLANDTGAAWGQLDVYPCEFCGSWHVGHKTRSKH